MSMMYKINNIEVRRLASVFIGQPLEVQARFIDIVAFVGGQSMPGPEHARQSYWQARPERYDQVGNKTEEILQKILTISLHTVLRYGILKVPEGRREHRICHIRDSFYLIFQGIDVFHRWEVWLEVAVCVAPMMECLRKSTLASGGMDCFTGFGNRKSEPIDTCTALLDGRESLDEKTGLLSTNSASP